MDERVRWLDEERTLLVVDLSLEPGRTGISIEERIAPLLEAARLAQTVEHPVDLLVDLRRGRVAAGGNWLRSLRQLNQELPPQTGLVVVVGAYRPVLLRHTLAVLSRIQRLHARGVHLVDTLAEARALLGAERIPAALDDVPDEGEAAASR
ncbi:MAG: hypothetical protein HPY64_06065 [Anaerolineae bacterium]|nr:hypothetical protein [Anaerolineae bacterium]